MTAILLSVPLGLVVGHLGAKAGWPFWLVTVCCLCITAPMWIILNWLGVP